MRRQWVDRRVAHRQSTDSPSARQTFVARPRSGGLLEANARNSGRVVSPCRSRTSSRRSARSAARCRRSPSDRRLAGRACAGSGRRTRPASMTSHGPRAGGTPTRTAAACRPRRSRPALGVESVDAGLLPALAAALFDLGQVRRLVETHETFLLAHTSAPAASLGGYSPSACTLRRVTTLDATPAAESPSSESTKRPWPSSSRAPRPTSTPACSRRVSSRSPGEGASPRRSPSATRADSRYVIFSATKPVVAERGVALIGPRDRPRAASRSTSPSSRPNGKDVITVEQVMLHTSGFPHAPFDPLDWDDRDARLARFGHWRSTGSRASRFEYHPTSAHWVLAELIERVPATTSATFVRARDHRCRSGLPAAPRRALDEQDDINELVHTGEPRRRESSMPRSASPRSRSPRSRPSADRVQRPAVRGRRRAGRRRRVDRRRPRALLPGAAAQRRRHLGRRGARRRHDRRPQHLPRLPRHAGEPHARARARRRRRRRNLRGMGHTVSASAFGHNGAGGQIAWADPDPACRSATSPTAWTSTPPCGPPDHRDRAAPATASRRRPSLAESGTQTYSCRTRSCTTCANQGGTW